MLGFKFFLVEAVSDENKLTHLEHAEDHVINSGDKGFAHAYHNLSDVGKLMRGHSVKGTTVTTKYDGSPSIVWGHHPETGQFFVGTKSVFNKSPLINYTERDINRNHKSPGLASKLKLALKHLPKITPPGKIYQGDYMHSGANISKNTEGDVEERDNKFHFKPNTLSYSTRKDSEDGKKIIKSKIGLVPHTEYSGNNLTSMKAVYNADVSQLRHHPDVHVISPHHDFNPKHFTPKDREEFENHMNDATLAFNKAPKDFSNTAIKHSKHLKTFINSTVKAGTSPSIEGYRQHLNKHYSKETDKVKTDKSKIKKTNELKDHITDTEKNERHFHSILSMHHSLTQAKNTLVNVMSKDSRFAHHIGGIKTKPEGFVVVRNNRPTKLVDRSDFSRANFLSRER
jgi:hypothetical protein